MCIAPLTLVGGLQTACHECWQCRERAINDWVGRNIAESRTAKAAHAVTLTYANGDHPAAALLTYSDVQKYLKKLRFAGYPMRYFAIGEYGSTKGRAHWHLMIYWQDKVPPHELRVKFDEPHWEHGFSFWDEPSHQAIRYNCKYIQKDIGKDERQGHLAMSKKPPLGSAYFEHLAQQYVEAGLAPQNLEYSFPDVTRVNKQGVDERVTFMLKDRPAELFVEAYLRKWAAKYPDRGTPKSPFLEQFNDVKLRERTRIHAWFAALPPNLSASQRLDVDRYQKRLRELDKLDQPLPQGEGEWSPLEYQKALYRVAARKKEYEDGLGIEEFFAEQVAEHRQAHLDQRVKEYLKERGNPGSSISDWADFNLWYAGWADREFKKRGI